MILGDHHIEGMVNAVTLQLMGCIAEKLGDFKGHDHQFHAIALRCKGVANILVARQLISIHDKSEEELADEMCEIIDGIQFAESNGNVTIRVPKEALAGVIAL